jgi:hypothetical protein
MRLWISGPHILGGLVRPGISLGREDLHPRLPSWRRFEYPPYKDHHTHMKHSLFGLAISVIFLCGPAYSAESTNEDNGMSIRETCEAVARADTLPLCNGKVTNCIATIEEWSKTFELRKAKCIKKIMRNTNRIDRSSTRRLATQWWAWPRIGAA